MNCSDCKTCFNCLKRCNTCENSEPIPCDKLNDGFECVFKKTENKDDGIDDSGWEE
jgi:hypothetical protein